MPRNKPTKVEKGDIRVAKKTAGVRDRPLTRLAGTISDVADQPPMLTLSAGTMVAGAVIGRPRLALAGARLLATQLVTIAIKTVAKRAVDRTRPEELLDQGKYERGEGRHYQHDYNSFPSGHTAGAVAAARSLARDYPAVASPALLAAGGIGAARVARGKHYLTDVIGGALIGLAADAVVNRVARRLSGRRRDLAEPEAEAPPA